MKMTSLKCTVLIAILTIAIAKGEPCPTWFIRESNRCRCGRVFKDYLECSQLHNRTKIIGSYCLTYTNYTEHFGACPYNANGLPGVPRTVPSDVSHVDEAMCGPLNRTGLLCSQCQPGLGPALFSHSNECKECMKWPNGWIVFFVRLTVPLTLFCVVVIIFQINIASPPINGFVIAAQIFSSILKDDPSILYVHGESYTLQEFVIDFYGIFTLDFFVKLIPSFCIHKGMRMTTVIALDYIAALYPIVFTVIVYMCISLHDKGNKVLTVCWKPFHKCLARFRQSWNSKGSVLISFSTFLLLSHCKICLASMNLVQFVRVWDKYGNSTHRMYYDATHELHRGGEYVGFVVLAITLCVITVVLPSLFVIFYQNRFFQRCLSYCMCRLRFTMIHELANITQCCFKNGTSPGTRDYRWFAGLYMVVRFIMIFILIQRRHLLVYVILLAAMAILVAGLRPYNNNWFNAIDSILWLIFALGVAWFNYCVAYALLRWNVLWYVIGSIPFAGIMFVACWKIIACVVTWCRACFASRSTVSERPDNVEDELPHRLLSPDQYTPLIHHQ